MKQPLPMMEEEKKRSDADSEVAEGVMESGGIGLGSLPTLPAAPASGVVSSSLASNSAVTQRDTPPRGLEHYHSLSGRTKTRVIEWNIMEYKVRLRKKKTRIILSNIMGRAENGTFTAVIGPSGSGKTSLLDCISLRNPGFTGCLRLNGQPVAGGHFFLDTGYVHQKELFFQHLTVREHLTFHAINRLSSLTSQIECHERVSKVIEEVDLERVADNRIGGGAFYITKGLSGGERKRLNIATELLADPSILMLDEPTSGLDSVMGELVCLLLRSLALRSPNRIIITAVHSPSSRLFMLFTHVTLLTSRGELAYWGRREDILPFLEGLGYACPPLFNPADFALELASVKVIRGREVANAQADGSSFVARTVSDDSLGTGNILVTSDSSRRLVEACGRMLSKEFEELEINDRHKQVRGITGTNSSFLTLITTNLKRAWMQQNREITGLIVSVVMNATLGLIFGLLYYNQMQVGHISIFLHRRNTAGFLFSLAVTLLISSSIQVCLHFPMDFTIIMREYYVGANTPVPYFLGRTIAAIPYNFVFLLMGIIPYWMTGLDRHIESFGYYCLVLFLLVFGSQSIGYFSSSFTANPIVGLSILPLLITPMILFSGMLYERHTVRPGLKWLQDLSLINYSYALLVLNQVKHVRGPMRLFLLSFLQVQPSDFNIFLIDLAALALGYRILAMFALMIKIHFFSKVR